jgi:tRNA1Val (adenine37-N6)-methyltransferase
MKVTTDACLFGAWAASKVQSRESVVGNSEPGMRKVLDIGAGTGLLSLMLAQKTNASIDSIEIDGDAFGQAKENIAASPWKERINIYHADAAEYSFSSKYDVIISNPPFYENELKSPDEKKNTAHHSGLMLQQLLSIIAENLSKEGLFFLLLPYKRNEETEQLINSNELSIIQKILARQSVRHDHSRIMIEGSHRTDRKMIVDEISIRDDQQQYTGEFVSLLKDYYLHL